MHFKKFWGFWLLMAFWIMPILAQDDGFDFSDQGSTKEDNGGGFDFSDQGNQKKEDGKDDGGFDFSSGDEEDQGNKDDGGMTFQTTSDKPLIIGFFFPVDKTPQRNLDMLTSAIEKHLGEIKEYDAISGVALWAQLEAMDEEERTNCVYDAKCLTEKAALFGASKVIVGTIQTEDRDRPEISLQLYDVKTAALENAFTFESSSRNPRKHQKELRPALYKLLGIKMGNLVSKVGDKCEVEEDCHKGGVMLTCQDVPDAQGNPTGEKMCVQPPEGPRYPKWQLYSAIGAGAAGALFIGGGVAFGMSAASLSDDVVDKSHKGTISQVDAQKQLDDASSKALLANIFYGIGGAALVTSAVLFIIKVDTPVETQKKEEEKTAPTPEDDLDVYFYPVINPDSAGLVTGFHF